MCTLIMDCSIVFIPSAISPRASASLLWMKLYINMKLSDIFPFSGRILVFASSEKQDVTYGYFWVIDKPYVNPIQQSPSYCMLV